MTCPDAHAVSVLRRTYAGIPTVKGVTDLFARTSNMLSTNGSGANSRRTVERRFGSCSSELALRSCAQRPALAQVVLWTGG